MKYTIKENNNDLDINVDDIEGVKENLLKSFQECQEGSCSCPTEEYKKLESIDIEQNDDSIQLHLKSKDGTKIDIAEINQCLKYTAKRIKENDKN